MSTRTIVLGTPPAEKPAKKRVRTPPASEIRLTDLIDKHLVLLYRETRALLGESSVAGKLSKDSANAMRENIRLLMDMKKKEKDLLDSMSAEELDALIKEKAAE